MNNNVYDNELEEHENTLNSFDESFFLKGEQQDSFLLELSDEDLDQIAGGQEMTTYRWSYGMIKD